MEAFLFPPSSCKFLQLVTTFFRSIALRAWKQTYKRQVRHIGVQCCNRVFCPQMDSFSVIECVSSRSQRKNIPYLKIWKETYNVLHLGGNVIIPYSTITYFLNKIYKRNNYYSKIAHLVRKGARYTSRARLPTNRQL